MPQASKPISIKFDREQRRRIALAAGIVGRERGGVVPSVSAIIREETMKGVDAIIAREESEDKAA